jgi:hypothetical protein
VTSTILACAVLVYFQGDIMALLDLQGLPDRRPELFQGVHFASTLTIGCGMPNPRSTLSLLVCHP